MDTRIAVELLVVVAAFALGRAFAWDRISREWEKIHDEWKMIRDRK